MSNILRANDMSSHDGFIIDLPFPPSVNRIWRSSNRQKKKVYLDPTYVAWIKSADLHVMAIRPKPQRVSGRYEIEIILDQLQRKKRGDAGNYEKCVSDYLQRIELIDNDKFADQVLIRWGEAPAGVRVIVRPS